MTREEIMQLNTDYLNGRESEHKMNELFNYVLELQKPKQLKIGHWIRERIDNPKSILNGCVKKTYCSCCGKRFSYITSYCPHCGAKMESEGKE